MIYPAPVEIVYETSRTSSLDATAYKLYQLESGLAFEECLQLTCFIENLERSERHTPAYLRKEDTLLPRTIEIDPTGERIFIHLKTHNLPKVGKGAHKRVTHSILYDRLEPKLVATAIVEDSQTTRDEIELLKKFSGSECIIDPLYIARHTKKSGQILFEIITPLYNMGSLRSFITKNPHSIPFDVKVQIAKDILTGSCTLNSSGYICSDNNRGNFFVHQENGQIKACIGDLGGYTKLAGAALLKSPFGPSARSGAPDLQLAYHEDMLTEKDLFSNHVYSLGRVLHFLYFEHEVPWIATFNQKYPSLTTLYKNRYNPDIPIEINCLLEEIAAYTELRLQAISDKMRLNILEPDEHFEFVIFSMLATDPETRRSNQYWLQYLNENF